MSSGAISGDVHRLGAGDRGRGRRGLGVGDRPGVAPPRASGRHERDRDVDRRDLALYLCPRRSEWRGRRARASGWPSGTWRWPPVPVHAARVRVIRRWSATGASYQFVLFPIVAVIGGALLLSEPVTSSLLPAPWSCLGVYIGASRERGVRAGRTSSAEPVEDVDIRPSRSSLGCSRPPVAGRRSWDAVHAPDPRQRGRVDALTGAERGAVRALRQAPARDGGARSLRRGRRARLGGVRRLVRVRNGETIVSDGPFVETKEQLGGYLRWHATSRRRSRTRRRSRRRGRHDRGAADRRGPRRLTTDHRGTAP